MSQQEQDKQNSQGDSRRKKQNTEHTKPNETARELLIAQVSQEARDIDYERWDGMA